MLVKEFFFTSYGSLCSFACTDRPIVFVALVLTSLPRKHHSAHYVVSVLQMCCPLPCFSGLVVCWVAHPSCRFRWCRFTRQQRGARGHAFRYQSL